jgi:hypothetical protein
MSNNYQNNYFPDDSDPAGQAEYFAQVAQNSSVQAAQNSQAQAQNNRLGYHGVPQLQPHAGGGNHGNLAYNDFDQPYPLDEAPVSPSLDFAIHGTNAITTYQARPLLPPYVSSPSPSFHASDSSTPAAIALVPTRPNTPVAVALVPTEPNTPVAIRHRPDFTAKEYLDVARAMVDINPFAAKHGQKSAAWDEVAAAVQAKGLFPNARADVIKNKGLALIKYQEVRMHPHSLSILH